MSRRKIEHKNTRKLMHLGKNSLCVTLPIDFIRKLRWRGKQKVVVSLRGKTISIKDWKE